MAKLKDESHYEEVRHDIEELKSCFLIGTYLQPKERDVCIEHLEELAALATTYGLEVVHKEPVLLRKIEASTFIGSGKCEELAKLAEELKADVVIFDDEMSPNQQRNLETIFSKPILDRTELILEIFSKHAQTKEARLQIELAKSRYQLPRLKRLWTHLSRQTSGGGGYLRGSGEKQIEIDRRLVKARITQLQKELEEVRTQRQLQRQKRLRSGTPTFAIIGYTNAGKSTLLNALTQADVLVEDKLFATLDTTSRKFELPNQQSIILIDTVGFIRKIPHGLVSAFKSTLEESLYTDILLHVIDISHPAAEEQAEATYKVLKELGGEDRPMITLLNKIDRLEDRAILQRLRIKYPKTIPISAVTREGFDELLESMIEELAKLRTIYKLSIPQSQYALISEIMREGHVLHTDYEENNVLLEVELPKSFEHKVIQYQQYAK